MNWFKHYPFIAVVVAVTILTVGTEGWLLRRTSQQARSALGALEQKRRERNSMQTLSPTPNEENEKAIERELTDANQRLATAEAVLTATAGEGQTVENPAPAKSVDAYFDLSDFVEKMRVLAGQAQVSIRPDEHFGFGSHATEGPDPEVLTAVFRQRVAIQFLLESLFETRPATLFLVQREHPLTNQQRARRNHLVPGDVDRAKRSTRTEEAGDFFDLVPSVSLRVPGNIDTEAFKLEFSGQTRTLRTFLNKLASCPMPFAVRAVETEALARASSSRATPLDTAVPIVTQTLSRFRVIVEFIAPVSETGNPRI